jgi:CDP-diglyceride synthetase
MPLPKIAVRSLSGSVYVASVILPLLFVESLYPFVIGIYAFLVVLEFYRLTRGGLLSGGACACLSDPLLRGLTCTVWIILPFALMALLPRLTDGVAGVLTGAILTLAMFLLVWVHDSFAYLTGILFGRRKLAPTISPSKTIEGAFGGALFALIAGASFWFFTDRTSSLTFWMGGAMLITLAANAGDLVQSKLKRVANVKDSGTLMPGHGGFFDRFDALLFTAPAWYGWVMLMH